VIIIMMRRMKERKKERKMMMMMMMMRSSPSPHSTRRRGNKWSSVILNFFGFVLPQATPRSPGAPTSDSQVAWGYQVFSRLWNKKKNKASNRRPFVQKGTPF